MKKLEPKYTVGLTDGEGSFHINVRRWIKNKNGYSISAEFSMDLVEDDIEILERLKESFDCGTVIPKRERKNRRRLQSRYHVTNLTDIREKIIPFFKVNPPQMPTKKKDFEIWCEITGMMDRGEHLTNEGLKKVLRLRDQFSYRLPKILPPQPKFIERVIWPSFKNGIHPIMGGKS